MLIPAIILFNLIKAGLNSVLTFLLFIPVSKIYAKISMSESKHNLNKRAENTAFLIL